MRLCVFVFSLFFLVKTNAQISNITFNVDMNTTAISPEGVYIAGSFQNWDPSTHELYDLDFDGIYSITIPLENDSTFEYKFINGNWTSALVRYNSSKSV